MPNIPTTVTGRITWMDQVRSIDNRNGGKTSVLNFLVAENPSWFDSERREFENGDSLSYSCVAWGRMADNIASSLSVGIPVSFLATRKNKAPFNKRDGERVMPSFEYEVLAGGPDLAGANIRVTAEKTSSQGGYGSNRASGGTNTPPSRPSAPQSNRRQAPAPQSAPAPVEEENLDNFNDDDEPPF